MANAAVVFTQNFKYENERGKKERVRKVLLKELVLARYEERAMDAFESMP